MDTIFTLTFVAVAPIWLLLLIGPWWRPALRIVTEPWVYAPLAIVYLVLVAGVLADFVATFSAPDLASVQEFVTADRGTTIVWAHLLVFDVFVGRWIVLDAVDRGVPHLAVLPCLLLTLAAGPVGLLVYLVVRTIVARVRPPVPAT